jgi:hypothetical protein
MKQLTKKEILDAKDRPRKEIKIPEWGGIVYIKTMAGDERDDFDVALVTITQSGERKVNVKDYRARLCVATIVDVNGNNLFTTDDIPILSKKSGKVLTRIFDMAAALNGIGAAEMKALEKNLKMTRESDSSSN